MGKCCQRAKAAIVLKNLPAVQCEKVLARLESSDLRTVFQAINELDVNTTRPFFEALDELARESQKYIDDDKTATTQKTDLPIASHPQQLADAADNRFGFLFARSVGEVVALLSDEHPREIANVLTNLPKDTAANVLQQLEPVHRVAVVRRLCDPVSINEADATNLAIALKQRLNKIDRGNCPDNDQRKRASGILEQLAPQTAQELAEQAGGDTPMLDELIARHSCSFSIFKSCNQKQIRSLFGCTDSALWSSALRECDPSVRKHILNSLTPSDSRLVGRQMIDVSCQVAPPGLVAQQKLTDALAAMHS